MDTRNSTARRAFTTNQVLVAVAVIAVIAALIWALLRPEPQIDDDMTNIALARDVEPPPMDAAVARSMTAPTVSFFQEIKSMWAFPEFTDDQRLNNGADGFGPIAHIVPLDSVSVWTVADFQAAGLMGRLVGGIAIDDTIPVATVPSTYNALALRPGNNCLYLANPTGAEDGWTAYITPEDTTTFACPATHSRNAAVSRRVLAVPDPTYGAHADVPAVARFHEGEKGTAKYHTFFGIKCAERWCLVLPNGVDKNDTLPPFHKKPGHPKHFAVRGWWDMQKLAIKSAGGLATFDRDHEGSVFPHELLGSRADADFDNWIPVATVHFDKKPTKTPYHDKWRFSKDTNEIEIIRDPASNTGWLGRIWNGEFVSPGVKKFYALVVSQDPHPGEILPGTARWAWRDKDEWIWVRCGEGCCWVSPPE